jgi:hypothetical protein
LTSLGGKVASGGMSNVLSDDNDNKCDERWGKDGNQIKRLFVGKAVIE